MKINDLFIKVPSYENFSFDKILIKNSPRKSFVLIHHYLESDFVSIVGFSDSEDELFNICKSHPRFGSLRHVFCINPNLHDEGLDSVKDSCLLRICNNVATSLALAEFHMLSKRYFKSKNCFDSAKSLIADACNILDNY